MPTLPVDLTRLRPGAKVKLRGEAPGRRKPYPRGWQEVAELDVPPFEAGRRINIPSQTFRVTSDPRWLPVELIEEIVL